MRRTVAKPRARRGQGERYTLVLRAIGLDLAAGDQALRRALKALGRYYGFRCEHAARMEQP